MKLTIDTKAKTIRIDELVTLGEITDELQKMLPDWKDYTLDIAGTVLPYWPIEPVPFVPFIPTSPWQPSSPWQPYQPQPLPTSPYQPYTPQQPWSPYYPQSPIYQHEPTMLPNDFNYPSTTITSKDCSVQYSRCLN